MTATSEAVSLERFLDYSHPSSLTATGSRIAWLANRAGRRSLLTAVAPGFEPRELVAFEGDDGQELSSPVVSPDGAWVVFVRGGDHGGNWERERPVDPVSSGHPLTVSIWSASTTTDAVHRLADGGSPTISPDGTRVLFPRGNALWQVPIDGTGEPAPLFATRGGITAPVWSPDGSRLAFVSDRGTHAFVGVYEGPGRPIRWLAPGFGRDGMPRWSPDGRRVAFTRLPSRPALRFPGPPRYWDVGDRYLRAYEPRPWSIQVADVETGEAREWWASGRDLRDSAEEWTPFLAWVAGDALAFVGTSDGWRRLYSIAGPGDRAVPLTPGPLASGDFSIDEVSLAPDRSHLVVCANGGDDPDDIDRRHLFRVPVDGSGPVSLTAGTGLEWAPVIAADGTVVFFGATAVHPPAPAVLLPGAGESRPLGAPTADPYPSDRFVVPRKVTFPAADGVTVHGQLFLPPVSATDGPRPGVLYIHGGPGPQQLLGWHPMDYYCHAYALNQYLANRGFAVLSVNYRSDRSYGHDYEYAPAVGPHGAAEYQDIRAAAHFLGAREDVDPARIGIYGGSYGGYLTAMALAHDSDLFAAGVDVHGVHDFSAQYDLPAVLSQLPFDRVAEADGMLELAWRCSPLSALEGWRSPVLLISGDDDRNVAISQTLELARRLDAAGVPAEHLVLPDETHSFLAHRNVLAESTATAEFLERHLAP